MALWSPTANFDDPSKEALKGRRFDNLEALAEYLERWNRTVAQVRIHGTTRQQVLHHFLEVEQPLLQPLPLRHSHVAQHDNASARP